MKEGRIIKVSGPVVVAKGIENAKMFDVARVSEKQLIGEIIELRGDEATIQVYEETSGLGPGEPVISTGMPLSVELAPGLITSIYDGIQRPLDIIRSQVGDYITRGVDIPGIDRKRKWYFGPQAEDGSGDFKAQFKVGDTVQAGDIIGVVRESEVVLHKIMVPEGIEGRLESLEEGEFTVEDVIATVRSPEGTVHEIKMLREWPVRRGRPFQRQLPPFVPLITGQRVIDTFFPIAKGGTACIPGPFGSGKTVVQHQLAKWVDADIIVYIGCGERGNEMTDVLMEFPELLDPRTDEPLIKRTVLIANTSNMPVAAREASVYTGITIAEYYRDMGYDIAVMADSTSRWAEAMREISGRLEEMPGEEGYPAYLGSRIADFYERAGRVICMGSDGREGSLSVIGAVSPPGGDLSDPVVQNTLRVVKVFWGLEDRLAYSRHFPAINWLNSYSLYLDSVRDYIQTHIAEDLPDLRNKAMAILQEEAELEEIVRLVGIEALSDRERLVMETARSIREDFLHQYAFHEKDTYTSQNKQYRMLKTILHFHNRALEALEKGIRIRDIINLPVREEIARMKYIDDDKLEQFSAIEERIDEQIQKAGEQD